MIRPSNWKRSHFYTIKDIFLECPCRELSYHGSHEAQNKLCQKLLTKDDFPGTLSIGNISETKNARTWEKYFWRPAFKG